MFGLGSGKGRRISFTSRPESGCGSSGEEGHGLGVDVGRLLACAEGDVGVLAVFLFGSVAREGTGRDVDVCLVLFPGMSRGECFDRLVEYGAVAGEGVDVHIFQLLPLYVRVRVIREGQLLLVKDEDQLYDLVYKTWREYGDFEPRYREYLEAVLRG